MTDAQDDTHQPISATELWTTYKSIAPWVLLVAIVYFGMMPAFWPEPQATMQMPEAAVLGEDVALQVTVTAWHSNYRVTRVNFTPDPLRSTAIMEQVVFYPISLRDVAPRSHWPAWNINRITWPRRKRYAFTVPLSQRWREGILQAGVLRGMLQITVEAPGLGRFSRPRGGGSRTSTTTVILPFNLNLTPAPAQ
jgi:hypothetical protein